MLLSHHGAMSVAQNLFKEIVSRKFDMLLLVGIVGLLKNFYTFFTYVLGILVVLSSMAPPGSLREPPFGCHPRQCYLSITHCTGTRLPRDDLQALL
jgi:hypothetical protein